MSKIKLSAAQAEVVRSIRDGWRLYRNSMLGGRYLLQPNGMVSTASTKTVDALLRSGVIVKGNSEYDKQFYTLTPLGQQISID